MSYEKLDEVLHQVYRKMKKEFLQLFEKEEISGMEYLILCYLEKNGDSMTGMLAKELYVRPSQITAISDKLVRKNWICRKRCLKDRRVVYLSITEEGKTLVQRIEKERKKYLKEKFKNLTDEQMQLLTDILQKLL